MTSHPSHPPVSALRERMIEDMIVRGFGAKTRHDYVRHVRTFSAYIGRSPDTAAAEEVRRFQLHQTETGVGAARAARAHVAKVRDRQGPRLRPQALVSAHPLNARWPHLPQQQRRRAGAARDRGRPAQLDLAGSDRGGLKLSSSAPLTRGLHRTTYVGPLCLPDLRAGICGKRSAPQYGCQYQALEKEWSSGGSHNHVLRAIVPLLDDRHRPDDIRLDQDRRRTGHLREPLIRNGRPAIGYIRPQHDGVEFVPIQEI